MAAPTSTVDFLDCLRKSGIVRPDVLTGALRDLGDPPADPIALANVFVREGLLTKFQAKVLLSGRYRGFRIGSYVVKDQIGQGGMGVVYLGEHDTLRRQVAIKVLTPTGPDDRLSVERFLREARAAASLDHPNIVRIHDVTKQGDTHCLIMEYVHGDTLDELLEMAGPIACGRAVGFITQAAAGLQHAYEKGFVHRDIKPGNLILSADGTVKILDMGLARSLTSTTDKLTELHDAGAIVGTADYIAPEQALNVPNIDIRADIYSLGATFFALVTGRPPFDGNTTQKLMQHQMKEAPSLMGIDRTFPPGLAAVVAKMMAKRPEDRFTTPADVIAALSPWLSTNGAAKVVAGLSNTDMASGVNLQSAVTELAMGGTKRMAVPVVGAKRLRHNKLVLGGVIGGVALFAAVILGIAWFSGSRTDPAAGRSPSTPSWQPTQPQPTQPAASKTAPKTAPKQSASAKSNEPVLYKFDPKVIPSSSFTLTGTRVTGGKKPILPVGYNLTCWKPESVGEFTRTDIDGKPAVGLASRSAEASAQFTIEVESALGVALVSGRPYRVRVEYMTRGDAAGKVFVQDPEDNYKILSSVDLPKTGGAWKSITMPFVRSAGRARLSVDANQSTDGGMIYVRALELTGQGGGGASASAGVLFRLAAADIPLFRNVKTGSNVTDGTRESLPQGVYFHGWKQDTVAEYFCEPVDGARAFGWSHAGGPTSGQIGIEVEGNAHSLNVNLTEGKTYTHKVTYKTTGGAYGGTYAQTQGTYQEVPNGRADLPDTGGEWRTVEVTWARPTSAVRILVDSYNPALGAVMYVREVVLVGAADGPTTSAAPPTPATPPRAEGATVYAMTAAGLVPFRFTFVDGKADIDDMSKVLPPGVWTHCWKKTSVAEFRGEVAAGSPAVGVTNLNDDLSGQILFPVEGSGQALQAGREYKVKLEYRTANDAVGFFAVRDPAYQNIVSADLPATGGEWRSAELTFRRTDQKVDAMVENRTVGEGNTLHVRKFEVVELK